jgi:type II secretory pathway pseudopilin PulG
MRAHPRPAFTLLEMVVVLASLSAALAMSVAVIVTMIKAQRLALTTHERLAHEATLADRFRADVHLAIGAPKHFKQYDAGIHCLILELPGKKYAVYDFRDDVLTRDTGDAHQQMPLPGKDVDIWFEERNGLIVLSIVEKNPKGNRPPYEMAAAMGGRSP